MEMKLTRRTYQRSIPLFLASLLIAFLIVHYFVPYEPIEVVYGSTLTWVSIISLMVWAFAIITMLLNNIKNLSRTDLTKRKRYSSILTLLTTAFFLILLLSDPSFDQGELYSLVYLTLVGRIGMGVAATGVTHFSYNIMKRLVKSRLNLEMIAFFAIYIVMWLRLMSVTNYYMPWTIAAGDWLQKVIYTPVFRALTIVTAISTIIVVGRALIGKEPGMIEEELI